MGRRAGLSHAGVPLTNVYPYTRDGRLLQDLLLYDSRGRPLTVGRGDTNPNRRILQTASGRRLYHSFPIRYFEPGTRRVARPNAAPGVATPRIATPPLRAAERRR